MSDEQHQARKKAESQGELQTPKCRDCAFFAVKENECRRRAPTGSEEGEPSFPICGPEDWCGEHSEFDKAMRHYTAAITSKLLAINARAILAELGIIRIPEQPPQAPKLVVPPTGGA